MPIQFMKSKPRLSFGFACIFGISVGIAVTQVQANIEERVEIANNNPHHIPDDLNPKLRRIEDKFESLKDEAKSYLSDSKENIEEKIETIHSLAFKGAASYSKPTFDYATGASN